MIELANGLYGESCRGCTYGPEALEDVQLDIVLGNFFEDGRDRSRRAQTGNGRVPALHLVSPTWRDDASAGELAETYRTADAILGGADSLVAQTRR